MHIPSATNEELIFHVTNSKYSTHLEIELAVRLSNIEIAILQLHNTLDELRSNTPVKSLIDAAGILIRPQIKLE